MDKNTTTVVSALAGATVLVLIYVIYKKKATPVVAKPVVKSTVTTKATAPAASGIWSIFNAGNINAVAGLFGSSDSSSSDTTPAVQINGSTYTLDSGTSYSDDAGDTYDSSTGKMMIAGVAHDASEFPGIVTGTVSGTTFSAAFDGIKRTKYIFDGVKNRSQLI